LILEIKDQEVRAITLLNSLVEALPLMRLLDKVTHFIYIQELAETLKDNDDLLHELAHWLEYESYPLPEELWGMRLSLLEFREAYRATYGQES
jgi:hypothetical protein